MMLLEREPKRTCEECHATGETFLLTIGKKWIVRLCHGCWEKVQHMRYQIAREGLQSVETK